MYVWFPRREREKVVEGWDVYVVREVGSDDVSRWYEALQPRCSGRDVVMSLSSSSGQNTYLQLYHRHKWREWSV
jgi:hypothetical protein